MTAMPTALQARPLSSSVKFQSDTLNFELTGQKNWDYDLKRVREDGALKIKLYVKSLDQDTVNQIKNVENPFVKSIKVVPNAIDKQTLIEFTLKDQEVETFDYLTDQPSKLIVDFYYNDSSTLALESKPTVEKNKKYTTTKTKQKVLNTTDRQPAATDILKMENSGGIESSSILRSGLFDGGDEKFERFLIKETEIRPEAIIKSQDNYYLNLPLLEPEFVFWGKMKEAKPDYVFSNKNTEENKQVRLLKKLFDSKKYLVFLKTANWFEEKYPKSEYLESIAYMKGDANVELWRAETKDAFYKQAQFEYQQALEKYPNSSLAERTSLLTGLLSLDQKDYLKSLQQLNAHVHNSKYDNRISKDYARLGAAFSLGKLKQSESAIKQFEDLEKESQDPYVKAEAAIRKADLLFLDKKYDQSQNTYLEARKKYEKQQDQFPNLIFNLMKAAFWRKDYYPSYLSSIDFVKRFPSHAYAPYALTRLGELLEILGAEQSKTVGAYLETHFRYGDNPKTVIARLHLLSTRMKGMKKEELDLTLKKMDELALKSDVENIDQFKVALIADGFAKRKDFDRSIEILTDYYQKNPMRSDIQQVTNRIVKSINDYMKHLSDLEQYKKVLDVYAKYSDTWLKAQDRIDTNYFLGLSYDNAGAYEEAIKKFNNVKDRMLAIQNTPQQKIIDVREYLPTLDSLYLKLAESNFNQKNLQQSYLNLDKIKQPFNMTEDEQIQRVSLAAELSEQKGDTDSAIRYLTELDRVWNGKPELIIPINNRLGQLQYKDKKPEQAKKALTKTLELAEANPPENPIAIIEAANVLADINIEQKKIDEAISVFDKVLKIYEDKADLPKEKFRLGDLYFQKGELKKAETVWSGIKGKNSDLWSKVAQDKLQQANWREEYKKYLKRIPAMSQMEKQ